MIKGYWYCSKCQKELSSNRVTYQELCDTCGTAVTYVDGIESYEDLRERAEEAEHKARVFERALREMASALCTSIYVDSFIESAEEALKEEVAHG